MGLDICIYRTCREEEDEILTWSKTGMIHRWFNRYLKESGRTSADIINMKRYEIPLEALRELRDVCERVVADNSKAKELLPVTSCGIVLKGSGSDGDEYDDIYFMKVELALENLNELLRDAKRHCSQAKYFYWAWW